jgi:hypothetical protein
LPLDDPLTTALIIVVVGVIITCSIIVYAMRKKWRKEKQAAIAEGGKEKAETKVYPLKL